MNEDYKNQDNSPDQGRDKEKDYIIGDHQEAKKDKKHSKKVKKIFIIGISAIVGIIVLKFVLGFMVIFGSIAAVYVMGDSYETRNLEEYMQFDNIEGERSGIPSRLDIFPKSINQQLEGDKYYYYTDNKNLFDNDYQIYLEKEYSNEEFLKEKERLASIKVENNAQTNTIQYNEKDFNLPAYVAIYADDYTFEYALLDEENQKIIYIYTRFMYEGDIEFDEKYLPINFVEDIKTKEPYVSGFNIYAFRVDEGVNDIITE